MRNAYEEIWGVAEDNYGIITTARAVELGVSRQNMVAMERSGKLRRLGQGVYQVHHHVPGQNDVYATAVALGGDDAYLRGASVLYMLGLTPANPSTVYVGTPNRVRRRFPNGYVIKNNAPADIEEFDGCEGIKCQRLVDALRVATKECGVELDRIADAARKANEKGLLTDEECSEFQD